MRGVEYAGGPPLTPLQRNRGTFAGLAEQTGGRFTERDCLVAAASGLLGGIVQVAMLRAERRRGAGDTLLGCVALARLRAIELEER
jgi:hypothetical protein